MTARGPDIADRSCWLQACRAARRGQRPRCGLRSRSEALRLVSEIELAWLKRAAQLQCRTQHLSRAFFHPMQRTQPTLRPATAGRTSRSQVSTCPREDRDAGCSRAWPSADGPHAGHAQALLEFSLGQQCQDHCAHDRAQGLCGTTSCQPASTAQRRRLMSSLCLSLLCRGLQCRGPGTPGADVRYRWGPLRDLACA